MTFASFSDPENLTLLVFHSVEQDPENQSSRNKRLVIGISGRSKDERVDNKVTLGGKTSRSEMLSH